MRRSSNRGPVVSLPKHCGVFPQTLRCFSSNTAVFSSKHCDVLAETLRHFDRNIAVFFPNARSSPYQRPPAPSQRAGTAYAPAGEVAFCSGNPILSAGGIAAFFNSWKDLHEREERAQWERSRMLAQCVLMPHSKKPLKATDVFKFPWDRLEEVAKKATKADFERMAEMFG